MENYDITLVADDNIYLVEMHQSTSMMHVHWKQHVEGELLKEKFQALLNIIKRFKPKRWLGNARAMHYTTIQDARWFFRTLLPQLIESSVMRYARIETRNSLMALDSMNLQDWLNSLPEGDKAPFEFRFFYEEEPALEWLHAPAY